MTAVRATRRSIIVGLDSVAVALALLAIAVAAAGGFVFSVFGVRVSFSTPQRTLEWLTLAVIIRCGIATRIGPFGRWTPQWQRLLDSIAAEPFHSEASAFSWRRVTLAALGVAAALAVLLHDQLRDLYLVPDLGDPLFSVWRIGWVAHQIVTDPAHLFDGNIFYPTPLTLTLSDPVILPALTIAPLLALGVHPVVAYNILFLSGFWLSGVATYLLVERLTDSARAAFIAGLMYACYAYRFEHYSHLELQMTQWMPLALLALHFFVSTGRPRYAFALAIAVAAQLYSSMYYAVFFLMYATVIGLGLLRIHRQSVRRLAPPLASAGLVALLIALPIILAFTAAKPLKGERGRFEVVFYSAKPEDYLRANRYSALWHERLRPSLPERTLFPGAAPLALAAIGLAPPLGTLRLVYVAGLLVAFDGSLGLNGIVYPLLYQLPGPLRELRSPARFAALVGLTLAVLAGFGARRALRWRPSRTHPHVVFAALVALVMIDAWPALVLTPVWKEPPPIYDVLKYTPNATIVEMPIVDDETRNLPFMYFSLWHWARMVNGYSGFIPKAYADFRKEMVFFPDARSLEALRRRGVTYVSVNCGLNYDGCGELMAAMRHDTRLRLAADVQWNGNPVQLYEVLPP
jgi:hypothetical protein